MAQTKLTIQS